MDNIGSSKKQKIVLIGLALLVVLVISYGFLVRKLTPVFEKSYLQSTAEELEQFK